MHLADFFNGCRDHTPVVLASQEYTEDDVSILRNRIPIAVGGGLPKGTEINGVKLVKGPEDRSLCEHVLENTATILAQEPIRYLEKGLPPSNYLNRLVFFVKDASPDSLMAVVLLLVGLSEVEQNDILLQWVESITSWDLGIMPANPYKAWPALASALSHSRFSKRGEGRGAMGEYQLAWNRSFEFLYSSVQKGYHPEELPLPRTRLEVDAVSSMRRMEQLYDEILGQAKILQLSVPLRDTPGRRVMVDALCFIEDEPSDAAKVFGRVDSCRAPGGRGFALSVSYRPGGAPWNKFTISSDPNAALDLTSLWEALERKETDKWRDATGWIFRKADKNTETSDSFNDTRPRSFGLLEDLDQLSDRSGEARPLANVCNIWADPWFLFPDASLIGCPGKDSKGDLTDGSRLVWQEVIDILWEEYNPLRGIKINTFTWHDRSGIVNTTLFDAQPIQFPTTPDESSKFEEPYFRYLDWSPIYKLEENRQTPSISMSTTNTSLFAALANRGKSTSHTSIRLKELPPAAACKLIVLNGGFAILGNKGCIVVDDWHDQSLDRNEFFNMFEMAYVWARKCAGHLKAIEEINQSLSKWEEISKSDANIHRIIGNNVKLRSQFITDQEKFASSHIQDNNARIVYEVLLGFWGLSLRASHISQSYADFEQSIKSLQEVRSGWLLRQITIIGLPATVASGICKPAQLSFNSFLLWLGFQLPLTKETFEGVFVLGEFLSWVIIMLLGMGLITFIDRNRNPKVKLPSIITQGRFYSCQTPGER